MNTSARRHPPARPVKWQRSNASAEPGTGHWAYQHATPAADGQRASTREKRDQLRANQQANQHPQDPACFHPLFACLLVSIPAYCTGALHVQYAIVHVGTVQRWLSEGSWYRSQAWRETIRSAVLTPSLQTASPNHQRPVAIILRVFARPSHTHHRPSATRPDSLGPLASRNGLAAVRAAPRTPNTGLHLGFRSHTESVHMRTSHACVDAGTW